MLDPSRAQFGRGDMLARGRIPKLYFSVLAACGQQCRGLSAGTRGPCQAVSAVVMTGAHMTGATIAASEDRNRPAGGGGRDLRAVGRPRKVDDIVVEDSSPVFR